MDNDTLHKILLKDKTSPFENSIHEKQYDVLPVDFSRLPYVIASVEKDSVGSSITLNFLNKKNGEDQLEILKMVKDQLTKGIDSSQIKTAKKADDGIAEGEFTYIELGSFPLKK